MATSEAMSTLEILTVLCALGCGLMAGFFLAFSVCVMAALGKLPPAQGIAAMQSINIVVINPWFLTVFFGTAAACLVLLVGTLWLPGAAGAAYQIAGGVLYLAGCIGVTMLFNVPRNNALARMAPSSSEGAALWASYLTTWTAWNHVRTVASLAAALLFALAFRLGP
jgi:uncharacterized membrane protein